MIFLAIRRRHIFYDCTTLVHLLYYPSTFTVLQRQAYSFRNAMRQHPTMRQQRGTFTLGTQLKAVADFKNGRKIAELLLSSMLLNRLFSLYLAENPVLKKCRRSQALGTICLSGTNFVSYTSWKLEYHPYKFGTSLESVHAHYTISHPTRPCTLEWTLIVYPPAAQAQCMPTTPSSKHV